MKGHLGVLTFLLKYGPAKVRTLAEKLKCSERSVQRYIQELNDSGYLIKYENHHAVLISAKLINKVFDIKDVNALKVIVTNDLSLDSNYAAELLLKLSKLESIISD